MSTVTVGGYALFGRSRAAAWLLSTLLFLTFVAVNLSAVVAGRSACGCFGRVTVSPAVALLVDAAGLGLLAAWAAVDPRTRLTADAVRGAAATAAGVGVAVAVWLGLVVGFGSTPAAVAGLRGDALFLTPSIADIGRTAGGTPAVTELTVHNRSTAPVRLIGGTTTCACTVLEDLPAVVPAGGRTVIRVRVVVPGSPGVFEVGAIVRTDRPGQETIPVLARGRSVRP